MIFTSDQHANGHESTHERTTKRRTDSTQRALWACTAPDPGPPNAPTTQLGCPPHPGSSTPSWPPTGPASCLPPPRPPRSRHRPLTARRRSTRHRPTCARGMHAPVSACMKCAGCRAPDEHAVRARAGCSDLARASPGLFFGRTWAVLEEMELSGRRKLHHLHHHRAGAGRGRKDDPRSDLRRRRPQP